MASAPPQEGRTAPVTPFELVGGRPAVARLVNAFYDIVEQDPAFAELRDMHAPDLSPMRDSLTGFLTAWMGGPRDWFEQNPGKCMMSLHKDLPIARLTSDQWVTAMRQAIERAGIEGQIGQAMGDAFSQMASGMIRRGNA